MNTNQTTNAGKLTLRDWVDIPIERSDRRIPETVKLHLIKRGVTEFTHEDLMNCLIIQKALTENDIRYYLAVMDLLYDKKIAGSPALNGPVINVPTEEEAELMRNTFGPR